MTTISNTKKSLTKMSNLMWILSKG